MFEGGFMHQAFAFGGEEGQDAFDKQIIYRSSLQNFLIDTGSEVIRDSSPPLPLSLRNWGLHSTWARRWPTIWMRSRLWATPRSR